MGSGRPSFRIPEAQQIVQAADEEIGVFEKAEQREVENHRQHQHPLRAPPVLFFEQTVHPPPKAVIQDDGKDHQEDIHRLAPAVKRQAEYSSTMFLNRRGTRK